MFKFILGILVGAAGYWAYRFWKGEDDTSWDQSWSSTGSTGTYGSSPSETMSTSGSTTGSESSS